MVDGGLEFVHFIIAVLAQLQDLIVQSQILCIED